MSSLPRLLGSFNKWAILRLGELVFVVGGIFTLVAQPQNLSILLQVPAVSLLGLLLAYFHPFAFGCADDQGIMFCRYFKLHFVPWNEIADVESRQQHINFELVVRLCRQVGLSKTVKFATNLSQHEVTAFRGAWTPEIVTWLMDRHSSVQTEMPQTCSPSRGHQDA
jgi:hypothetical protein